MNTFIRSKENKKALLSNLRWALALNVLDVNPPNLIPSFVFISIIKFEYLSHILWNLIAESPSLEAL